MPYVRPTSMTTCRRVFAHNLRFLAVISILLLLATKTNGQAASEPGIHALAADAAAAISIEVKGSTTPRKVLVVDFAEMHGKPTELGQWLASEFSRGLNKEARGFFLISRGESLWSVAQDRVVSESFDAPDVTACYEEEGEGALVAEGITEDLSDRVDLRLKVWRISDRKQIFEDRIAIPLTETMRALHARPVTKSHVPPLTDVEVWVNPEHDAGDSEFPASGKNGYSYPSCVYCTQAGYSNAATKAKIQGTVSLSVVVGADGSANRISLVHGLPCGLNQKAIDSVRQWKFKPATGAEGKPAAVAQTAELMFHMY
jgi:TonB family protein